MITLILPKSITLPNSGFFNYITYFANCGYPVNYSETNSQVAQQSVPVELKDVISLNFIKEIIRKGGDVLNFAYNIPLTSLDIFNNGSVPKSILTKLNMPTTLVIADGPDETSEITLPEIKWRDEFFTQYNEADKQILNSAFGEYLPMSISLEIENILNT